MAQTKSSNQAARKSRKPERTASQRPKNARATTNGLTPSERIDQHIAGILDWRGKVLATIRRIMLDADPAVTEDWKWMGTPVWYCDGMVAIANPHTGKVKCTFSHGAHFPDADHLFNNGLDGKEWRAIDIFENDKLDEAALRRLVKTAIAYNRSQQNAREKSKSGSKNTRRLAKA
jgi:hypothetical protein